jgi:hypothetical protein
MMQQQQQQQQQNARSDMCRYNSGFGPQVTADMLSSTVVDLRIAVTVCTAGGILKIYYINEMWRCDKIWQC